MRARSVVSVLAALVVVAATSTAMAQGGTIFPGVPVNGTFMPSFPMEPSSGRPYMDYYMNVTVPGTYQIDLVSPNSSAYDPYLYLLQYGRQIDTNDDGGGYPNAQIRRFLGPGLYVFRVSSFRSGPVGPAAFSLSVQGVGIAGIPSGGGFSVQVGIPITGTFLPGLPIDPATSRAYIDYALPVAVPGTYQIDLMSPNSSAYDPYLYLYQYGAQLDANDDGGGYPNSRITRFLNPGLYTVRVSTFRTGPVPMPAAFTLAIMRR